MFYLSFYRFIIRPLLFCFDAEKVHHFIISLCNKAWAISFGRSATKFFFIRNIKQQPLEINGLRLQNPIGLAAGFDKNALLLEGIENLGFGFVEIGTVTPLPQIGNSKPRLSREISQQAILNRMGFNNDGAETIADRLRFYKKNISIPVGVNLGKNKDTPNALALKDYESLLTTFKSLADYFTINVSSPNTPNLKELQSKEFLESLGEKISQMSLRQNVFLKLSPDISEENLKDICNLCKKMYTGLILTNTIPTDLGGISGRPLKKFSLDLLKRARTHLDTSVPIISVGGIETPEDVKERIQAGANAVQIYTALIYEGPGLVRQLLKNLSL